MNQAIEDVLSSLKNDLTPSMHRLYAALASVGSEDVKTIEFYLSNKEFSKKLDFFRNYISLIYDEETENLIIDSIENSRFKGFYFKLYWDSSSDTLLPYFRIYNQNLSYYEVGVMEHDFSYDYQSDIDGDK